MLAGGFSKSMKNSPRKVAIVGPVPIRNLSNNTVLMRFYLVTEKQRLRKLFEYIQIISDEALLEQRPYHLTVYQLYYQVVGSHALTWHVLSYIPNHY